MDMAKELRDTILGYKNMGCVLMGDICDKSLVGSKAEAAFKIFCK